MPRTLLVAGAAGSLGRAVVRQAVGAGLDVRALVHRTSLPADLVDRVTWVRANAVNEVEVRGVCDGVDAVVSCIGASVSPSLGAGRRSYTRIDTPANRNLVRAATAAGVRKFVYVSVACHEALAGLEYVRAHERVVELLGNSELGYTVVRPTGFFSAFAEMLPMARRGRIPIISDGSARTNPIHETDVASACLGAIEATDHEVAIGGPEVLTRREIVEAAFQAVGRPVRLMRLSPKIASGMALLMRPINPRVAHLTEFVVAISTQDVLATPQGARGLTDYFAERVRSSGIQ